ncbi:MAG: flagellar motor protein MotB [Treponema sp.]|nr:flagellar motor protein MotB [Treponema sp.]
MAKKKKKDEESGSSNDWMTTYGDMVTLLLCFFAILFNPVLEDEAVLQAISDYFSRYDWGYSLSVGRMQPAGNIIADFPSQTRGRSLADALRRAVSLYNPEIRSNRVRVTQDERGVVISFASDVFFEPASAVLNMEASRGVLLNLAILLSSEEVDGRKFRIEGHTDSVGIDPSGPWVSNWQLSTERALSVLYLLTDLGVSESRMQVAGFGSTVPISTNDTEQGRANNRRVDIVIIDDAHL